MIKFFTVFTALVAIFASTSAFASLEEIPQNATSCLVYVHDNSGDKHLHDTLIEYSCDGVGGEYSERNPSSSFKNENSKLISRLVDSDMKLMFVSKEHDPESIPETTFTYVFVRQ